MIDPEQEELSPTRIFLKSESKGQMQKAQKLIALLFADDTQETYAPIIPMGKIGLKSTRVSAITVNSALHSK